MGKVNNVKYGEGRGSRSCLGCAHFSTAIGSCGKPSADPDKEVVFEPIVNPSQHTCNSYKFDRLKAPKL